MCQDTRAKHRDRRSRQLDQQSPAPSCPRDPTPFSGSLQSKFLFFLLFSRSASTPFSEFGFQGDDLPSQPNQPTQNPTSLHIPTHQTPQRRARPDAIALRPAVATSPGNVFGTTAAASSRARRWSESVSGPAGRAAQLCRQLCKHQFFRHPRATARRAAAAAAAATPRPGAVIGCSRCSRCKRVRQP